MRTCRCACGATLAFLEPPELWEGQVLAHVRTKRHQDYSRLLHPDEAVTIIDPPRLYEEHLDQLLGTRRVAP